MVRSPQVRIFFEQGEGGASGLLQEVCIAYQIGRLELGQSPLPQSEPFARSSDAQVFFRHAESIVRLDHRFQPLPGNRGFLRSGRKSSGLGRAPISGCCGHQ